jgi:hypothetical protein
VGDHSQGNQVNYRFEEIEPGRLRLISIHENGKEFESKFYFNTSQVTPHLPLRGSGEVWYQGWDIPTRWAVDAQGQGWANNGHGGDLYPCSVPEIIDLPDDDSAKAEIARLLKWTLIEKSCKCCGGTGRVQVPAGVGREALNEPIPEEAREIARQLLAPVEIRRAELEKVEAPRPIEVAKEMWALEARTADLGGFFPSTGRIRGWRPGLDGKKEYGYFTKEFPPRYSTWRDVPENLRDKIMTALYLPKTPEA